jgi:hypothetical protein
MTRRVKSVRAFAALSVLIGFMGLWTAFAQSTSDLTLVDKVGWWTRRPGALPTNNPTNFEVAAGVQGDESIAALRILIRGEITKATLVMGEADAPLKDVAPGKLRVCPTSSPWLVVDGGKFADAPKPDCTAAVELTRTKDPAGNGSWSGDVTPFLAGARSEVSLMAVPSPDPTAVLPPTYYIKFLARVDAEGTPDVKPASGVAKPPVVGSSSGTTTPTSPRVTSSVGSVTPAPTTAPPATTVAPTEAAAAPPKRFAVATPAKTPAKPWGKLFLLLPLSLIGAAIYTGGRKFWAQRLEAAPSS